ncbi:hypothetical protein KJ980_06165 [Patescibacteria group bacterium]|nr:hypothetical protein [Patescibacteria group bacterium]MBU4099205.1 hypothetical protein [Patescibacteria group bacterium]
MNIKHIWSVLCKESVVNQDDNNISIYGVLEELSVFLTPAKETGEIPKKLGIPINYEIVSMWQRNKDVESAKAEIVYVFVDPENNELLKNTQIMEIPKASRRLRSRMKIVGMPLTKEGDYTFQVKIKEEGKSDFCLVAELPLEIKIKTEKTYRHSVR